MNTDLLKQLTQAVKNANHCEVQRLAALVDAKDASLALESAAENGHVECVQVLLSVANPLDRESHALWEAIANNHVACVQLLAPVSKIAINHMFAAVDGNNVEVITSLIEHIPPPPILTPLWGNHWCGRHALKKPKPWNTWLKLVTLNTKTAKLCCGR